MSFQFGKAVAGGRPIDQLDIQRLRTDELHAMREKYLPKPLKKSDDVINRRVAEELAAANRTLEFVEEELKRRIGNGLEVRKIEQVEDAIEDLADIVDAENRCEAIDRADENLKRRLKRRGPGDEVSPCENQ